MGDYIKRRKPLFHIAFSGVKEFWQSRIMTEQRVIFYTVLYEAAPYFPPLYEWGYING